MKTPDEAATLLQAVHRIADIVQCHADEAERNRRLSPPVVSALADAGLFRMGLPADLGGLEVSPLTFYRAIEAVAALDGSAGWCAFIGASSAFGGAFLSNEAAEEIYGRDSRVITGGSIAPVGKALVRDGGYVVSGRWPYASGCQHSSWLFGACHVIDGDRVRLTPPGHRRCDSRASPLAPSPYWRTPGTSAVSPGRAAMTLPSMVCTCPRAIRYRLARGWCAANTTKDRFTISRWSACSDCPRAP